MKKPCKFCGFESDILSDEDCPAIAYKYTPAYRPPDFATVPKGWVLVERPLASCGFDRRTDLPVSKYRFGVIGYSQPLSDEDVKTFQLQVL